MNCKKVFQKLILDCEILLLCRRLFKTKFHSYYQETGAESGGLQEVAGDGYRDADSCHEGRDLFAQGRHPQAGIRGQRDFLHIQRDRGRTEQGRRRVVPPGGRRWVRDGLSHLEGANLHGRGRGDDGSVLDIKEEISGILGTLSGSFQLIF